MQAVSPLEAALEKLLIADVWRLLGYSAPVFRSMTMAHGAIKIGTGGAAMQLISGRR
jgi:hypothetical protein